MEFKFYKNFTILIRNNFAGLLLFLIGIFICLKNLNFGLNTFGDTLDGRFNNYALEHFYRALTNQEDSFVNGNFYYPLPYTIQLSNNHWLLGLVYAFFRIIGFDRTTSFNIWGLFGFIVNFWVCYYVLIKFRFSKNTSAIGAFIFTFNQIIFVKTGGHIQLNFRAFIPLTLLFSKKYFETLNFKYISYICLCITLQLLCDSYIGNFLALYIVAIFFTFLGGFKIFEYKKFLPKFSNPKTIIFILIINIILLIIYGIPYLQSKEVYNLNVPIILTGLSFNFKDLITIDHPIWNFFTNNIGLEFLLKTTSENSFFMGFGVWIAIIAFVINLKAIKALQNFDKIIIKSTLFVLIFFLLNKYLGTFNFLQYLLPNFTNLRAFTRFFYVIFFGFIYVACIGLDQLKSQLKFWGKFSKILYFTIPLIIVTESLFAIMSVNDIKSSKSTSHRYKQLINQYGNQDSITLFLISENNLSKIIANEINAMIASQELNIKTINGYSSKVFFGTETPKSCLKVKNIIKNYEDEANKVLLKQLEYLGKSSDSWQEFKYDRKKLLIFLDQKLCKI